MAQQIAPGRRDRSAGLAPAAAGNPAAIAAEDERRRAAAVEEEDGLFTGGKRLGQGLPRARLKTDGLPALSSCRMSTMRTGGISA